MSNQYTPRTTAALAALREAVAQVEAALADETYNRHRWDAVRAGRQRQLNAGLVLAQAVEAELPPARELLALAERMVAAYHVMHDVSVPLRGSAWYDARDKLDRAVEVWDAMRETQGESNGNDD